MGSSGSSAPTGPARPPLPHDHRAGEAGRRQAPRRDTVQLAYVDQSRESLKGTTASGRRSPAAPRSSDGQAQDQLARLRLRLGFKGRSAEAGQDLSGGERTASPGQVLRAAATSSCSTSRPTISTSTPCARSRTPALVHAARSSSATIAGSSIASRPTCSPSRDSKVTWFEGNYQILPGAETLGPTPTPAPHQVQEATQAGTGSPREAVGLADFQTDWPKVVMTPLPVDSVLPTPAGGEVARRRGRTRQRQGHPDPGRAPRRGRG